MVVQIKIKKSTFSKIIQKPKTRFLYPLLISVKVDDFYWPEVCINNFSLKGYYAKDSKSKYL